MWKVMLMPRNVWLSEKTGIFGGILVKTKFKTKAFLMVLKIEKRAGAQTYIFMYLNLLKNKWRQKISYN